jgi:hypothetical protein
MHRLLFLMALTLPVVALATPADSDDDGISTAVELQDGSADLLGLRTPDSDRDGIPDFQDLDSDDDGLPAWLDDGPCFLVHPPPPVVTTCSAAPTPLGLLPLGPLLLLRRRRR